MRRVTPMAALLLLVAWAGTAHAQAGIPPRVTALEGQMATQQAETASLWAAVRALQVQNAAQADALAALEAENAAQADILAALQAGELGLGGAVTTLQGNTAALQGATTALAGRVTALEGAPVNACPADTSPVCCAAGTAFCAAAGCVDLQTDTANCGACGTACGAGLSCIAGVCALGCEAADDCGGAGDTCTDGACACGHEAPCAGGEHCRDGVCSLCGNGVVDEGETCDDGNDEPSDQCGNDCAPGICAPDMLFAVGIYGATSCAQRCALEGQACVGISTTDADIDGRYFECGDRSSGVANETAAGGCDTVLGGNGCSEYGFCACAPTSTPAPPSFAVGIYGTTTCDQRCALDGGTCLGLGTDDSGTNGLYWECGDRVSGVADQTAPGTCGTVLGGNGCSEFTLCNCALPSAECTEPAFAVGIYGTTTCADRCALEGSACVGMGTDDEGLNGLHYECGDRTSGVGDETAAGDCGTVLGGNGCSEYTMCRCYPR